MLQDRAHTITAAQRLEQKRSGPLVFFFPFCLHTMPCADESVGRGEHDDTKKLLYIDTKRVCVFPRPLTMAVLLCRGPGEHPRGTPVLGRPPLGWPGDAPASVTGASLADQWSPPSKAPLVNGQTGVHTIGSMDGCPSPPPTRLSDAQQAFAAASHTPASALTSHPNVAWRWTIDRSGSNGFDRHGRRGDVER